MGRAAVDDGLARRPAGLPACYASTCGRLRSGAASPAAAAAVAVPEGVIPSRRASVFLSGGMLGPGDPFRLQKPMQVDHHVLHLGVVDARLRFAAPGLFGRGIAVIDADEVDRVEVEVEPLRILDPSAEDEVKLAHAPPLADRSVLVSPACGPRRQRHWPTPARRR